jgi:hypothetical protein
MTVSVEVPVVQPPDAWREPMLLVYPNGATASFDPRGRFFRGGDLLNGFVLDRFELDGERVVAFLRPARMRC